MSELCLSCWHVYNFQYYHHFCHNLGFCNTPETFKWTFHKPYATNLIPFFYCLLFLGTSPLRAIIYFWTTCVWLAGVPVCALPCLKSSTCIVSFIVESVFIKQLLRSKLLGLRFVSDNPLGNFEPLTVPLRRVPKNMVLEPTKMVKESDWAMV